MVQKYVLLKWQDGVQEVAAIEPESTGLLRYYVNARVEEFGRLAIGSSGKYADLIILDRRPRGLEKVVYTEDGKAKEYLLTPGQEHREGGRTEYRFDFTQAEGGLDSLVNKLKEILKSKNKKAEAILKMSGKQKTAELEEIRRAMKLRALNKEADVLGFIEMLLSGIALLPKSWTKGSKL